MDCLWSLEIPLEKTMDSAGSQPIDKEENHPFIVRPLTFMFNQLNLLMEFLCTATQRLSSPYTPHIAICLSGHELN
jgi:hypothetical protein